MSATQSEKGLILNSAPGTIVPVPSKPGLLQTDVHGGWVYRGPTIDWLVSPSHRVPYVGYAGDGSQAVMTQPTALQQRQKAAGWGLFAVRTDPGNNYDAQPMAADPSLPVHRFAIGDHVPGVPLGLTSRLGHG